MIPLVRAAGFPRQWHRARSRAVSISDMSRFVSDLRKQPLKRVVHLLRQVGSVDDEARDGIETGRVRIEVG